MRSAMRSAALAAIVFGIGTCTAAAQEASVVILQDPLLVGATAAFDVTPDGQFVAGIGNGQVFRWSEAGGVEILSPSDWQNTHTVGISDDGTKIVSTLWHDDIQLYSPSLWTEGEGWVALGGLPGHTPPDGSYGSGYDISGDGSVAVGLGWTTNYRAEGWYWTEATGVVGLGRPPNERSSRASAISGDGHVIVGFFEDPVNGSRRPVRWTDGGAPDLFLGEQDIFGETQAASADGRYLTGQVGWADGVPPDDDYAYAFLYSDDGGYTRLWPISTHPLHSSIGNGVSDKGVVIGWSGNFVAGAIEPSIWFPGEERMRSLTQLLEDHGAVMPTGWELLSALAITPDGTTVVGQAFQTDPPYNYGAFVARIPPIVFEDGFEGGDLSSWSVSVNPGQ